MQIVTLSPDLLTATVGSRTIKVGEGIPYIDGKGKLVHGIIKEFREVDKKDMKSPWCWVQEAKTGDTHWFPLRLWNVEESQLKEEVYTSALENNVQEEIKKLNENEFDLF